jgi:hypothetical protein
MSLLRNAKQYTNVFSKSRATQTLERIRSVVFSQTSPISVFSFISENSSARLLGTNNNNNNNNNDNNETPLFFNNQRYLDINSLIYLTPISLLASVMMFWMFVFYWDGG